MAYLETRANVNSLFGNYTVAQDQTYLDDGSKATMGPFAYDYILRDPTHMSLQMEIENVGRKANAVLAPNQYMNEKNRDLLNIERKLSVALAENIRYLLSEGYSQSQAEKIGLEKTKQQKDFLMDVHKKKYPKEIKDLKPFF